MPKALAKILICTISATVSWLALSYVFFPIKLSAPPDEYFAETMTHMIPLKIFITLVFVLLALFLYEQGAKKSKNK